MPLQVVSTCPIIFLLQSSDFRQTGWCICDDLRIFANNNHNRQRDGAAKVNHLEKNIFLRQWEFVTVTLSWYQTLSPLAVIRWKWKLSHVTLSARSDLMIAVIDSELITTDHDSPSLSLIPTTMVSVVPRGTMPATGSAQGPLPCCISIQQSTLSPEIWKVCRIFVFKDW